MNLLKKLLAKLVLTSTLINIDIIEIDQENIDDSFSYSVKIKGVKVNSINLK
jgi:hypothetical protein